MCTFWSWRTLLFIVIGLLVTDPSMLRLPIYDLFLLFSGIRKNIAETGGKNFLVIWLLYLFIRTSINWFVTFNIIWSGFCLSWIFWIFIIFEKWSSLWIIWFQYLRICITFSFCFKIVRHVKICQLFIYDRFSCLKILFFQWLTSLGIVFGRMITLLHPTMTFFTCHSHFAPCSLDRLDFIRKVPKLAPYWFVIILFRISSIILNIMGIGTFISLMILSERTPNSFVLVNVEIVVFFE